MTAKRSKRFLEILPVELLRDAGSGDSPLHCDISLGGRNAQSCELGGRAATLRHPASGKLWPGSVLLELAGDLLTADGDGSDVLTVGVRFDRGGETVDVGSTTLSLSDAAQKEDHRRWLDAPISATGGRSTKNLLQLKARLHEDLGTEQEAQEQQEQRVDGDAPEGVLRRPKHPTSAHPRPPPPRASATASKPTTTAKPAAAAVSGAPSPKTVIVVEADPALLKPGTPVTSFRSKFFGKPSAAELADSLRSVLGVPKDAGEVELVDASRGTPVEPRALENGAAVRLQRCRTPPPKGNGRVQFTHEEVVSIEQVDASIAATAAQTTKSAKLARHAQAEEVTAAHARVGRANLLSTAKFAPGPEPEPEPEVEPQLASQQQEQLAPAASGAVNEAARQADILQYLSENDIRAVDIDTSAAEAVKAELAQVRGVLRENITLAEQRGSSLADLEEQAIEMRRLAARFHVLGKQISEAERKKFAATILQAIVRGFLARMRNKKGIYSLRLYVKKLAHDPAEMASGVDDDGNPHEAIYTVWSNQIVQDFLDQETKGMHGPSGAYDGRFDLCHSPPASLHVHMTWDKCRRLSNRRPIWADKTWEENGVADEENLTVFWHWDF